MPNPTLMVVEDDPSTRRLIEFVLSKEGFQVVACSNGQEAMDSLEKGVPDLIVLDLMMPYMDGIQLCHQLRARAEFNKIPLLVLTAKDQMVDKYEAFSAGADDFIMKPFDPLELLFRVRAFLRLMGEEQPNVANGIELGRVKLEPAKFTAYIEGKETQLTKLETAILHYLMTHSESVISAEQLANQVLGHAGSSGARSVDAAQAHIRNLRQKIEPDPNAPTILITVGRKGYRFIG